MSENSKCFCHLTVGGESYEVKDAVAREELAKSLKFVKVCENVDITVTKATDTYENFLTKFSMTFTLPEVITPKVLFIKIKTFHANKVSHLLSNVAVVEGMTNYDMHITNPTGDIDCVETLYHENKLDIVVHCGNEPDIIGNKIIESIHMLCTRT